MTVDFGFVPTMSIGSTVFADPNNNGIQDITNPLEDGIADVTVQLFYDSDNNPATPPVLVGTTMTDADGNYYFPNLPEGNYTVTLPTPPGSAPVSSTGATAGYGRYGQRYAGRHGRPDQFGRDRAAGRHGDLERTQPGRHGRMTRTIRMAT